MFFVENYFVYRFSYRESFKTENARFVLPVRDAQKDPLVAAERNGFLGDWKPVGFDFEAVRPG